MGSKKEDWRRDLARGDRVMCQLPEDMTGLAFGSVVDFLVWRIDVSQPVRGPLELKTVFVLDPFDPKRSLGCSPDWIVEKIADMKTSSPETA